MYHLGLFVFFPRVFLNSSVTGARPVTTDLINVRTTTKATTTATTTTTYPFTLPMVSRRPNFPFIVVLVVIHSCCPLDHPSRVQGHLPSILRSMSLRAPFPAQRGTSRALLRSFRHPAAWLPARSLSICPNPPSGNIITGYELF